MTLEDKFTKLVEDHRQEIDDKIKEACAVLDEAVKLSEQYGIPFYSSISFLSQSYFPKSYEAEFGTLDHNFVCDLTNSYPSGYGPGWEHSAVC